MIPLSSARTTDGRGVPWHGAVVVLCALVTLGVWPEMGLAATYSPEHPEVKAMVDQAVAYLNANPVVDHGGQALVALALVKAGQDESNPVVQQGVEAARALSEGKGVGSNGNYHLAMGTLLLTALDGSKYRAEIEKLVQQFLSRQKEHGGWGYMARTTGDTSMTQYAVLSLWEAAEAGIETPVEVWERVLDWLLRTQDPTGAYGYQGTVAEGESGTYKLVNQVEVRHSMVAAGVGSLYICQDHLRLPGANLAEADTSPTGFQKKKETGSSGRGPALSKNVNLDRLSGAQISGSVWLGKNFQIKGTAFTYYYMYALERYESFRAAGRETGPQAWYDAGVEFLKAEMEPTGGWRASQGEIAPQYNTSFAILFLVRSTKKSLIRTGRFGSGLLTGGRGLPQSDLGVELRGGQVKARALEGPAEQMLRLLDDPTNPQFLNAAAAIEQLQIPRDPSLKEQLQAELRRLAGGESPEAREAAVTALGRVRDFNNVPVLIFALSDPDARVVAAARRGLEFISRKFRGFGPEDNAPPGEVAAAIERWKAWYRELRPDAEFPE